MTKMHKLEEESTPRGPHTRPVADLFHDSREMLKHRKVVRGTDGLEVAQGLGDLRIHGSSDRERRERRRRGGGAHWGECPVAGESSPESLDYV